jgi:signal transduction histidine kinase
MLDTRRASGYTQKVVVSDGQTTNSLLGRDSRVRLVASIGLLLGIAALTASASAVQQQDLLRGYSLTSWSHSDDTPLGSVNALVQDVDGYLWIGSDVGLFRFDGSRFTAWDTGHTPLPPNAVWALFVSRDGSLWVGLADGGGIHRIFAGRLQPQAQQGEQIGFVAGFAEDKSGTMWAVSNFVLYRLRGSAWEKVALPWPQREGLLLQAHVSRPYVSRTGDLYVGTRLGVFRRVAGSDTFQMISREFAHNVSQDPVGNLWATDVATGFKRVGAATAHDPVVVGAGSGLMHDRKGNFWVATLDNGLWQLPAGAPVSAVRRVGRRNGLLSDSVRSLLEDRDGNIWVGTTGGLHRLSARVMTPLENVGFVHTVEAHHDGHVWGGTASGVVRFPATPTEVPPTRLGSPGLDVRSLYSEPGGPLWVGTTDGLWRGVGRTLTPVSLASRPHMQVLSITPDTRGALWLGDGDWLFRWDGSRLTRLELPDTSGGARITAAHVDHGTRLWVGFAGGRVGYVDPKRGFRTLGPADGWDPDAHNVVHTIYEDARGVVWIGSSGGLSRFAEARVVTLRARDGLPGRSVFAILEDAQQSLWLSVDRGVVRVARHELERALENRSYQMRYRLYDTLDGLAGATVGTSVSMQARDGTIWLVRSGGVTLVHPRDLSADPSPPQLAPVRIEAVVANDRPFSLQVPNVLPPGTNRIQVNYTAVALSSTRVRFRHRLEGFDRDWVDAGTRRTAFYTNLLPGTYRVRVEAIADGSSASSTAEWDFSIQPAFYQTRWFQVIGVAAALATVWVVWRLRLRFATRRFSLVVAERARLSREIHDTLLQSLVGVALQFDAIAENLGPSSTSARDQLVRVRRQVEAYIRDARQSIWDLRSPVLETKDLPTVLREFGKRAVAGTSIRFTATITRVSRQCPSKIENQLLRIGQEAITNAARHAGASRIDMAMEFVGEDVVLRVSDDGRGFDYAAAAAAPDGHYGLLTMKERAEELGGCLRIESMIGSGTVVEAIVPTSVASPDEVAIET